uniref:Uncharacterized protein n=1 Tax=Kalanchoe fedtschenkoi TaxID=63787 RepID=A0A7N0V223_KALFE
MEAVLIHCVQNSLRNFMFQNAIFMCERLCAEFPSESNLQLLAGCYLQNHQAHSAYHVLKGTQKAQSRYLFALSCFEMKLLDEAESALCPPDDPSVEVPNGAAGHYLLGLICRYTDRKRNAVHHLKQALVMDPLLWAAYEELCSLGAAEGANTVFSEAAVECIQKQFISVSRISQSSTEEHGIAKTNRLSLKDSSPRNSKHIQGNTLTDFPGNNHGSANATSSGNQFSGSSNVPVYNTRSPLTTQLSGFVTPPLCRKIPPHGGNVNTTNTDGSCSSTVNSTSQAPRRKFVDEGKFRKISERFFSDSGLRRSSSLSAESGTISNSSSSQASENGTNQSSKYLGSQKLSSMAFRMATVRKGQSWGNENSDEGNHQVGMDDSQSNLVAQNSQPGHSKALEQGATVLIGGSLMNSSNVLNGVSEVMSLLRILGEGLRLSLVYQCQDALKVYLQLPAKHYNTCWVLSQVGKAHFELVNYLEADRAFSLARRQSPHSLEGMDIYSTVLYHLKEDMKLSYLAHELVSTDRLAPQSWCAMGNCYSLQKDHETALKTFQRAWQLNSRFAYAHTLCGHEYVALEDLENGIKSYQEALRNDSRHYNAWYGLGMIYLRQEKYDFAEHHFRMAYRIHPRSSVIMSYLGTALHALQKSAEALEMIVKAIEADKKNPLPMYQKANILVSEEYYIEALKVLEELKEYAPRESSVYALMGKIYKRLNMHEKAMLHFGLALDLKPSATDVATIK